MQPCKAPELSACELRYVVEEDVAEAKLHQAETDEMGLFQLLGSWFQGMRLNQSCFHSVSSDSL